MSKVCSIRSFCFGFFNLLAYISTPLLNLLTDNWQKLLNPASKYLSTLDRSADGSVGMCRYVPACTLMLIMG